MSSGILFPEFQYTISALLFHFQRLLCILRFLRNILKADDNINISEQPIDYLKKYIIENVGLEQEER